MSNTKKYKERKGTSQIEFNTSRLSKFIESQPLTLQELSMSIGIDRKTLYSILATGKASYRSLKLISEFFNVAPEYFTYESDKIQQYDIDYLGDDDNGTPVYKAKETGTIIPGFDLHLWYEIDKIKTIKDLLTITGYYKESKEMSEIEFAKLYIYLAQSLGSYFS